MFVQIKCSFCDQPFDFDSSSGGLLADCPHCGKQNTIAAGSSAAKDLTVQRDAPNLSGGRPCPSCKTQIARDAVLCIHCGYNLVTRQKVGSGSWFAANQKLVFLGGGALVVMALAAAFLFWPEPALPPPVAPAAPVAAVPPPSPPAAAVPVAAAAETNVPAQPVEPPPPPGPTPEELAAQQAETERLALAAQAEAERSAFEAKKAQAEKNLRLQLDTREPLHKLNDAVELRRKNGVLNKGTLQRFSGTGTNRVAVVVTATGEIEVPLVSLDPSSRRRMDADFREAFIQHVLSTKLPPAPESTPAQ